MSNNDHRNRTGDRMTIYPRGQKRIYVADFWFAGNHCRKSLRTKNVRVARQRAVDLESRLQQGHNPLQQPTRKTMSLRQATDDFLNYQKTERRRAKTLTKYEGLFKIFNEFVIAEGHMEVNDVDLSLIDHYRGYRHSQIGERSMHNEGVMLKTFLGWCADRSLIALNPLASRKFRRPKYEPLGGPTLEQVNQILASAPSHRYAVFAMLAFTGMRSGECQHLLPDDIDFAGNWVHVISRPGAETKTGNDRKLPIHPRLRPILDSLPKSKRSWLFTALSSPQYPAGGHHLNMKRANEDFQEVLNQLGIPAGKKAGGFTLHSLRSFFKTFCVNEGIPREVVDKWQDHAGDRRPTASDLYYKLSDEKSQQFMMKVPFGDGKPTADTSKTKEA